MKLFHEDNFADRYFYGHCGSSVHVEGGETYYVGAGGLRDVKLKASFHIQVANKAPWDKFGGSAPQYADWPPA